MIITLYLLGILLIEGLGIPKGREFSLALIISLPCLMLVSDFVYKKIWQIPIKISLYWMVFLIISLVTTFFSSNFNKSFEYHYYFISLYFIFLYFYNHRELFSDLILLLFWISGIYACYMFAIYIGYSFFGAPLLTIPTHGYQFVYSRFGSHTHLGDMMVLTCVALLFNYIKVKKKVYLIYGGIAFLFILFSFSRSAYFSLIVTLVFFMLWYIKYFNKKILFTFIVGLLVALFMNFLVVKEFSSVPYLGHIHLATKNLLHLNEKEITAKRFEFIHQSVLAIVERPLTGYGPGNFLEASGQYTSYGTRTHSAHNLVFDVAVEYGVLGLLIFLLIIGEILRKNIKSPTLITFMLVAFLVNSLTDYTYRIYSYLMFFIALSGIGYSEHSSIILGKSRMKILLVLACISIGAVLFFWISS